VSRKIVLRPDVPDDMHGIVVYLEQSSIALADRFIASTFAAFDELAAMPGMGSPKQFADPKLSGVRSRAVPGFPNHLIYYLVHPDAVVIVAILHGARDVGAILSGRVP
jgi:plasmid stabilization system protein ParE